MITAALEVTGRAVLVGGGSPAALGVISDLQAAGAEIIVCAESVPTTVRDLADRGLLTWYRRSWTADDLAAAALVVPADADPAANAAISGAARTAGRPCLAAPRTADPGTADPGTADPGTAATGTAATGTAATGGQVTLVGGGPGDRGLLTLAGLDAIRRADVIICDRLAPLAALSEARAGARVIDVAKIPRGEYTPQERINELLVEHGRAGRRVVRLKGGDSFIFGRGGEELLACAEAGVPVTVIPGVSSAIAAPALAGIPLTHRNLTQGVTIVSAHLPPGHPGSTLDWAALARANTTLVIMMGVATLPEVTAELLAQGLDAATPAATIANAGLPSQRSVRADLSSIAAATSSAGLTPPAITVIGAVAGFGIVEEG